MRDKYLSKIGWEIMKILLVEDDFLTQKLMKKFLSKFGNCDTTIDGYEAFAKFKGEHDRHSPYDLIILDIILPSQNGDQVLAEIRQYEEYYKVGDKAKVIITTSVDKADTVYKSYQNGCEVYMLKPVNINTLKTKILDVMNLNLS